MDLATERRTGQPIDVDVSRPRAIGIFGKRGSGKTTTPSEIAGAAAKLGHLVIIIDPLSAIRPPGHRRVYLGPAPEGEGRLWLDPTAMSPDAWLALFELKMSDPMGISLFRAVLELNEQGAWWSVQDLIEQVHFDDRAADKTKEALENRLALARSWGIFSYEQIDPLDVFQAGVINVLDVGAWEPGPQSLRNLVVRLLADRLFVARRAAWAGSSNRPALNDPLSSSSKGLSKGSCSG